VRLFDTTNTYLKVFLGLVQVEKMTRITTEIIALEREKELGRDNSGYLGTFQSAIRVSIAILSIAALSCSLYVDYLFIKELIVNINCRSLSTIAE
jgi:hypothetical protein